MNGFQKAAVDSVKIIRNKFSTLAPFEKPFPWLLAASGKSFHGSTRGFL
jgi:hypothetical protein